MQRISVTKIQIIYKIYTIKLVEEDTRKLFVFTAQQSHSSQPIDRKVGGGEV